MSDNRPASDGLRPSTPEPSNSGEALVAAAQRKRRRSKPVPAAREQSEPPPTRRRRKPPPLPRDATAGTEADRNAPVATGSSRAWMAVCVCAALALLVLSAAAAVNLPRPMPVDRVEVRWLDGPQAPQREIDGWLATFPGREQLAETNGWVMGKLTEHLLAQPGVAEVRAVRLRHEPVTTAGHTRLVRVLEVAMGMRRPYMPGVLVSGTRVWVDRDGVVLPGTLPGPDRRRPLLRQLEMGGGNLRHAVEAWRLVEPMLDNGLVATIDCAAPLDERGARGIVLNAAAGSRLVWGRPDDSTLGRDAEAKARDLVHTIRCQGDLSRIATVNVRFAKPFYTLR